MQSLLPDQNRHNRDRTTFYLMLAMFFLVWFMFLAPRPPAPNIDDPILQRNQAQDDPQNAQWEAQEGDAPRDYADDEQDGLAETIALPEWTTLGSMDPNSDYRMLITFTNRGAVPSRIELNTRQFRDVNELSGYLGQIIADQRLADESGDGVTIQVVGPGTPAHRFGLQVGDKIVQAGEADIKTFDDLRNALLNTKPGDFIDLTIVRNGARIPEQRIQLAQHPKDIIRPESVPSSFEEYQQMGGLRGVVQGSDQLSFLMTLQQIDGMTLDVPASQAINNSGLRGMIPIDQTLADELPGVALRDEYWEIVRNPGAPENEAVFRRTVPAHNLEVLKTYRLTKRSETDASLTVGAGYDLTMNITVRNLDTLPKTLAYQLDGPTGLPVEGGWYAMKMGPQFGWYGIRDIVVRLHGGRSWVVSNNVVHTDRVDNPWLDISPEYLGVDSLYFQCTLKTDQSAANDPWHSRIFPIRVGTKNTDWRQLTNISFRMWSQSHELQPGEEINHTYTVFAGPKDVKILAEHDLGDTISYGWFWFAAIPLLAILHFFHGLGMPYAMAIVALTVCVRLLLFPLSRKQAIGAMKMAEIQPELKALAEKYKDDIHARSRAQSALFKKHNYHPLSGCLPVFIQLPIFIGLYKALTVDAGLYGSPMISSTVRWCRDLSAPDMLVDWSAFWNWLGWTGFNTGQTGLGPYFNLLPLLTVILFLIQMMITMPPPTDDQSRLQRKVFQYMMIFMGLLFFKFPSGLCLYFIVSTTWGLAERRFIPKPQKRPGDTLEIEEGPSNWQKKPVESKKPAPMKRGSRSRDVQQPAKPEGRFAKWWREVQEKAAEQQKLGQQNKHKEKKRKKR
ncbi:MAG: YidC/Oxa1 family insertase periplasmic-domain containing protein [Planctomycetaceae bacterium]|nr:YidC/Oxa1 family insertase periplasmic-domain containing protein [Planctomycetaceae bacterium]